MPAALFGIPIAEILGIGAGATGIGLTAAGVGQPSQGDAVKQMEQQQLLQQETNQKQQQAQEQSLFKHFAPDVQGATGGALSDASFAQMVAELSGQPGDIGLAQQTVFGPTTPGLSSGGIG